eukprot:scaffold1341_cov151-Pinguiococcus_pyrenoidosus.AAC.2
MPFSARAERIGGRETSRRSGQRSIRARVSEAAGASLEAKQGSSQPLQTCATHLSYLLRLTWTTFGPPLQPFIVFQLQHAQCPASVSSPCVVRRALSTYSWPTSFPRRTVSLSQRMDSDFGFERSNGGSKARMPHSVEHKERGRR